MKIEFDTMTATFNDAVGLAALLVARYGAGVVPASYERVGDVECATGAVTINRIEAPAPDGYPTATASQEDWPKTAPVDSVMAGDGSGTAPARDSAGIPWDERIHTSTKTTTANGQWTRRRNTPDATFDAVMAELRAANTARTMEAAAGLVVPAPPAPTSNIPPVPVEPTAAEAFTPPANVVIAPAVPTVPAPPATGEAPTFLQIMQMITPAQRDGKLDKAKLDELLAAAGIDGGVPKLVTAPAEARSTLSALLSAHLA